MRKRIRPTLKQVYVRLVSDTFKAKYRSPVREVRWEVYLIGPDGLGYIFYTERNGRELRKLARLFE